MDNNKTNTRAHTRIERVIHTARGTHLSPGLQPLVQLIDPVLGLHGIRRVSPVEGPERRGVERVVSRIGHA